MEERTPERLFIVFTRHYGTHPLYSLVGLPTRFGHCALGYTASDGTEKTIDVLVDPKGTFVRNLHRFNQTVVIDLPLDEQRRERVWGIAKQLFPLPSNASRVLANNSRLSWFFRWMEGSEVSICATQFVYLCFQGLFEEPLTSTPAERLTYEDVYGIVTTNLERLSKSKL